VPGETGHPSAVNPGRDVGQVAADAPPIALGVGLRGAALTNKRSAIF
jgi:hypothetical protein